MVSADRGILQESTREAGKTPSGRTIGFMVLTAGAFALGANFLLLTIFSGDE